MFYLLNILIYFTALNFILGVDVGIYIIQFIFNKLHTYATPYAWLPALEQNTVLCLSLSGIEIILLYAPLNL